jgi:chromosome segregation protein
LSGVQAAEQEADAARTAVLAASTALSALLQARDHAASVRDRIAADRERLDIEARELEAEVARAGRTHEDAVQALADARAAHEVVKARRVEVEAQLAQRRTDRDRAVAALGATERELAAKAARLHSLEELEARRSRFGEAARLLLAESDRAIGQRGAVADQLEVERTYERAVDALLGEVLQYVLVDRAADVSTALAMVAEHKAGRCGFVVLEEAAAAASGATATSADDEAGAGPGARRLSDVVRPAGPYAAVVSQLIGPGLIVDTFEEARALSRRVPVPVATRDGDVLRGGWLVLGGPRGEAHGILESRAEVLSLRDQVEAARASVETLSRDVTGLEFAIDADQQALAGLVADQHAHEKAMVGFEAQTARTAEDRVRAARRLEVVATERSRADGELTDTERRREEAIAAIVVREGAQRAAEEHLGQLLSAQQSARIAAEAAMRLVSDSRTEEAALTERVAGLDLEVTRLEDAARELMIRVDGRRDEIQRIESRSDELRVSIVTTERALDQAVVDMDALKRLMQEVDERVAILRQELIDREQAIRSARQLLDAVRSEVMQLEVARATATSDLTHASAACFEAVGMSLEDVAINVERMQAAGELVPPSPRIAEAPEDEEDDTLAASGAVSAEAEASDAVQAAERAGSVDGALLAPDDGAAMTEGADAQAAAEPVDPEPVILDLRRKIDRLGPVNMMAIEQFDELESRHTFLTTQRKDLLDSIAQTGEAIRKIEKTTRERFEEAFHSINAHFEKTFTTLFGGGRAGLVLIDQENDPESGIDIIAQPPGKRLQNVQLLSGGEKALTAMALMFAVFKHRPSPFCLLDEIDAPLDDANIGRFIEMLQGMQEHTQFILITHNRKTMEIADRLYGVTMEEPGVSKLISLQLN